jgi:hypothetical protein
MVYAVRSTGRRSRAIAIAILWLAPILAGTARADECEPAKPDQELSAAKAAGEVVLTGESARHFLAKIRGQHIPITTADYVFLSVANGVATMSWIDDAASRIALRCDWEAKQGTPLAAIIAAAISAARP